MKQMYMHRTRCEEVELEEQVIEGRLVLVDEDGEYYDRRFWNTGEEIDAEWRAKPVEERAYLDYVIAWSGWDSGRSDEENDQARDADWERDKDRFLAAYVED